MDIAAAGAPTSTERGAESTAGATRTRQLRAAVSQFQHDGLQSKAGELSAKRRDGGHVPEKSRAMAFERSQRTCVGHMNLSKG